MNYGIIDLGSNTVRLNVFSYENERIIKIFSKKEVVGLAAYVVNGELSKQGIQKACATLNRFKNVALKVLDLPHIYVFATASLRNIQNSEEAAQIIKKETSLTPHILSFDEEAHLGFTGLSQNISLQSGLMIDIGGASTEFVQFENFKPVNIASMQIGCLNLYFNHVQKVTPSSKERKIIKQNIKDELAKIDWYIPKGETTLVGVGGTVRATLKLAQSILGIPRNGNEVTANQVVEIYSLLKNSDKYGNYIYHAVYKTVPERTLTIFSGISILKQAMKKFNTQKLVISNHGVREGYLIDKVLNKNVENSYDASKQ